MLLFISISALFTRVRKGRNHRRTCLAFGACALPPGISIYVQHLALCTCLNAAEVQARHDVSARIPKRNTSAQRMLSVSTAAWLVRIASAWSMAALVRTAATHGTSRLQWTQEDTLSQRLQGISKPERHGHRKDIGGGSNLRRISIPRPHVLNKIIPYTPPLPCALVLVLFRHFAPSPVRCRALGRLLHCLCRFHEHSLR